MVLLFYSLKLGTNEELQAKCCTPATYKEQQNLGRNFSHLLYLESSIWWCSEKQPTLYFLHFKRWKCTSHNTVSLSLLFYHYQSSISTTHWLLIHSMKNISHLLPFFKRSPPNPAQIQQSKIRILQNSIA
jgi:hypothetical protein